jgi:hypothetical protein
MYVNKISPLQFPEGTPSTVGKNLMDTNSTPGGYYNDEFSFSQSGLSQQNDVDNNFFSLMNIQD